MILFWQSYSWISLSYLFQHPDYNNRRFLNDIQLLKLDSPVTFSSVISPICLHANDSFNIGDILTVTGWVIYSKCYKLALFSFNYFTKSRGMYEGTTRIPNLLKEVNVTVNPNNVCTEKFNLASLRNTQLCAGDFNPIHDSCQVNLFYGRPLFVSLHITHHKFKKETLAVH